MPDDEQARPAETAAEETQQVEPQAQSAEEFDAARAMDLIKKLRGEIKELTPKAKKAAELEAIEAKRREAEMTEVEKLNKQLTEAQSRLKHAEHVENQRAAAEKVGLPATFAKRIMGETPEEMEADAKEILESLPKPEKRAPAISPTNPSGGVQGKTTAQRLAELHGQGADVFSIENMQRLGGGVVQSLKGSTEQ